MRWLLLLLAMLIPACFIISGVKMKAVCPDLTCEDLTYKEKILVNRIIDKALTKKRKYYYIEKLKLLLNTPHVSLQNITQRQIKIIRKSAEEVKRTTKSLGDGGKEYINREEDYESKHIDGWESYRPNLNGPHYYVNSSNPLDILVNIRIRLNGPRDIVDDIMSLEDAIEKHLNIKGFSVNLIFVLESGDFDDVFDVRVEPSQWATSHNWAGDYRVIAHELMHIMGLPDEYDRIEHHAGNKYLSKLDRLRMFLYQMDDEVPKDSYLGIMSNHYNKPLERHVCAVVGLGKKCVEARKCFYKSP